MFRGVCLGGKKIELQGNCYNTSEYGLLCRKGKEEELIENGRGVLLSFPQSSSSESGS